MDTGSYRTSSTGRRGGVAALVLLAATALSPGHAAGPDDSTELQLENLRIVSQTRIDRRNYEIELRGDLRNLTAFPWTGAEARWVFESRGAEVLDVDGGLQFGRLEPGTATTSDDTLRLKVSSTLLRAIKTALPNAPAGYFRVTGVDEPVFKEVLNPITAALEAPCILCGSSYGGAGFKLAGDQRASYPIGAIITVDPQVYMPQKVQGFTGFPARVISADYDDLIDQTDVTMQPIDVAAEGLVIHGTLSGHVAQDTTKTNPAAEVAAGDLACDDLASCEIGSLPFRLNNLELAPGLFVSGQVALHAIAADIALRWRDSLPSRATVDLDLGWSANLQLRAEQEVTAMPDPVPVASLPVPLGYFYIGPLPVAVQADVQLVVGAEADLRAGIEFATEQTARAKATLGWAEGEYWSDNNKLLIDVQPVNLTTPQLTDDTQADGTVYAALQASLTLRPGYVLAGAGPYLGMKGTGHLNVSPTADPWWRLDAGWERTGGFALEVLGFNVADWPLPPLARTVEVNGEYRPPAGTAVAAAATPLSSGDKVRWALALRESGSASGYGDQRVAVLADGGAVLSTSDIGGGMLFRTDAQGNLVWARDLPGWGKPRGVTELPDGKLLLAGKENLTDVWVGLLDANGQQLFRQNYGVGCEVESFAALPDATPPGAVLVGSVFGDTCLARFDNAGNLLWAKRFLSAQDDRLYGAAPASDGGILLAGYSRVTMDPPTGLRPALVMKLDAAGNLLWAQAVQHTRGGVLHAVTEGDNGDIYAAGIADDTVLDTHANFWVARFKADGSFVDYAGYAQDLEAELALPLGDDGYIPTEGGSTPYDLVRAITRTNGGLVAVGYSGLGEDKSMWALKVSHELDVAWMTVYDGDLGEELTDVVDAGDGLLVAGPTNSFLPAGIGGAPSNFLAKLPYDGLARLTSGSGGVSRYMQPKVSNLTANMSTPITQSVADTMTEAALGTGPKGSFAVAPMAAAADQARLTD